MWSFANFSTDANPDVDLSQADRELLLHNFVAYLMEFFRPRYIVPQTLKIAQEMEAMGCNG